MGSSTTSVRRRSSARPCVRAAGAPVKEGCSRRSRAGINGPRLVSTSLTPAVYLGYTINYEVRSRLLRAIEVCDGGRRQAAADRALALYTGAHDAAAAGRDSAARGPPALAVRVDPRLHPLGARFRRRGPRAPGGLQ